MQPIRLPSIAFPSPYCGQKCVHLLGKEVGTHLSDDVPFPMPIYPAEVYRARNVIFTVARYHPLSRAILTLPSPRPAFPFRRTILRIPGGCCRIQDDPPTTLRSPPLISTNHHHRSLVVGWLRFTGEPEVQRVAMLNDHSAYSIPSSSSVAVTEKCQSVVHDALLSLKRTDVK